MTPEQIELARKAMALPGWEWRDGMAIYDTRDGTMMRGVESSIAYLYGSEGVGNTYSADCDGPYADQSRFVVHLADPTGATGGALLKLLGPCEIRTGVSGCARVLFWHSCLPSELPGRVGWSSDGADYGPTEDQWESMVDEVSVAWAICLAALALGRWPGGAK